MSLTKSIEQSDSERVDNNKNVRVLAIRGKKITTTTTSAIFVGGKLLTASIKVTLLENKQDVRLKKI